METPDRQCRNAVGNAIIAAAADRQDGGEAVGHPCRQIPGAVATHRESGEVDAGGIDRLAHESLLERLRGCRQVDGGRGGLRRARRISPGYIHPAFVHAALRCEHEAWVALAQGGIGQPRGQILELLEVVVAPFASAMQEEHEWIPVAIASIAGDGCRAEQSIAEFDHLVPLGDADGPLLVERRQVGVHRGGALGDGWHGLHRCFLGAGGDRHRAGKPCQAGEELGAGKRNKCAETWHGWDTHQDVNLPRDRSPVSHGGAWTSAKRGRRPRRAGPGIPGARTTSAPRRPVFRQPCPAGRGIADWSGP